MKPRTCFLVSGVLVVLLAAGIAAVRFYFPDGLNFGVCPTKALLGIYCPGCGGTRAFNSLANGQLLKSLRNNAVVPYCAAVILYYFIRGLISIITRGKIKMQPFSPVFFYVLLALAATQCLVKNALHWIWKIDMM